MPNPSNSSPSKTNSGKLLAYFGLGSFAFLLLVIAIIIATRNRQAIMFVPLLSLFAIADLIFSAVMLRVSKRR